MVHAVPTLGDVVELLPSEARGPAKPGNWHVMLPSLALYQIVYGAAIFLKNTEVKPQKATRASGRQIREGELTRVWHAEYPEHPVYLPLKPTTVGCRAHATDHLPLAFNFNQNM